MAGAPPAAYAGQPPDPSGARTVEELTARLRSLRAWAGMSYRIVHREVARHRLSRGVPEQPVYNTVYRCFQPGRSRLDAELVVDIAQVLLGDAALAEPWRAACQVVAGRADAAAIVEVGGQLPAQLPTFVGRGEELREAIAAASLGGSLAISGMPGVGKTQLAVHAAHALARAGQGGELRLFVDLRGYDPERPPADPAAVLDGFLRRLGLRGDQIQHLDLAGRTAQYQRLLAGKRAFVLLDNAASAEQVRPLLPDDPGCFAIVTSRSSLTGLPGVRRLSLAPFTPEESLSLLREAAGSDRVTADAGAAARIAEVLGNLPLALAVTAAHIRANPDWTLADHLERLTRHRDAFRLDDAVDLSVSLSYRELPADSRRMFRLLALHPGTDVEVYAAAALAGTDLSAAQGPLDQLLAANLLVRPVAGRYAFHDLIRVYATDRAHDEEPASARRAALTRLFEHYESAALLAMEQYEPHGKNLRPTISRAGTPVPEFADRDAATAWLGAERANLLAAARHAAGNGWPTHAGHQSDILLRYLQSTSPRDAEVLHTLALDTSDPSGRVRALNNLGNTYLYLGRPDEALELFQTALPLARQLGDRQTERRLVNHLGNALTFLGRGTEAVSYFEECLLLLQEEKDPLAEGVALDNLGILLGSLGRYAEAIGFHRDALATARRLGERAFEGNILGNLGWIYGRLERNAEALECHQQALAIARELDRPAGVAIALDNIGAVRAWHGDYEGAEGLHKQALETAIQLGDRELESAASMNLGVVYSALGRHADALDLHKQALEIARDSGLAQLECEVLNAIGETLLAMGSSREALDNHTLALELAKSTESVHQEARAHDGIASAASALGDQQAARTHWQHALRLYTQIGVAAGKVRARLAEL